LSRVSCNTTSTSKTSKILQDSSSDSVSEKTALNSKSNQGHSRISAANNGTTSVQHLVLSTINRDDDNLKLPFVADAANKNNNNLITTNYIVDLQERIESASDSRDTTIDNWINHQKQKNRVMELGKDDGTYKPECLLSSDIYYNQKAGLTLPESSKTNILTANRQSKIFPESFTDSTSSKSQYSTDSLVPEKPSLDNVSKLTSFMSKIFRKRKLDPLDTLSTQHANFWTKAGERFAIVCNRMHYYCERIEMKQSAIMMTS